MIFKNNSFWILILSVLSIFLWIFAEVGGLREFFAFLTGIFITDSAKIYLDRFVDKIAFLFKNKKELAENELKLSR